MVHAKGYDLSFYAGKTTDRASAKVIAKDVLKIPIEDLAEFLRLRADICPSAARSASYANRVYNVTIVIREWLKHQDAKSGSEAIGRYEADFKRTRPKSKGIALRYKQLSLVCAEHRFKTPHCIKGYIEFCIENDIPVHWNRAGGRIYVDPNIFAKKYPVYRLYKMANRCS